LELDHQIFSIHS